MAEKCTNTSSPFWRLINPYPLASLNHFTVPVSMVLLCFLCVDVALNFRWTSAGRSRRCGIACCSGTASSNAPLLYITRQELSLLWVIFAHPEKLYNQIN